MDTRPLDLVGQCFPVWQRITEALAFSSSADTRFGIADINQTKLGDDVGIHCLLLIRHLLRRPKWNHLRRSALLASFGGRVCPFGAKTAMLWA